MKKIELPSDCDDEIIDYIVTKPSAKSLRDVSLLMVMAWKAEIELSFIAEAKLSRVQQIGKKERNYNNDHG